jgi:hypothetical protein
MKASSLWLPTQNYQPHPTNTQKLTSNTKNNVEKNNIKKIELVKNNDFNIFKCGKGFHIRPNY